MIHISAGHFPERPGACFGTFCEHNEAMHWAILIVEHLTQQGCGAVVVPTGPLKKKIEFINGSNPQLAVEIHFNSFKIWEDANRDGLITDDELHHAGRGCETLYYPESQKGVVLAHNVQDALTEFFPPDRGIKEGWYRMNPKNGPDYFLEKTACPSIIVEPDFIHKKNKIQDRRRDACIAIAEAVIKTKGEFYGA